MDRSDRSPMGKAGLLSEEVNLKLEAKAEKELQQQIMGWLEIQGIFAGRQRMDKKSNLRIGWPDIVCAVNGTPLALECKSATGKQTDAQVKAQARMNRDGWRYYVVRTLAEVVQIVRGCEK